MVLHLFLFLLLVCLLLSASEALASWLVLSSAFLLAGKGQAQQAPPSAEAPLPRQLPRLSTRLQGLVGWSASTSTSAPLA
jgi:hypothetical protein